MSIPVSLIRFGLDAGYLVVLALAISPAALVSSANDVWAAESTSGDARPMTPLLRGVGAHDPRGRLDPDSFRGAPSASFEPFRLISEHYAPGPWSARRRC
jgi:hypothetical protein